MNPFASTSDWATQADQRMLITGIGTATPLGTTYDAVASGLIEGRSTIRAIENLPRFQIASHNSRIASWLDAVPCPGACDPVEFAQRERLEQLYFWCASEALVDAGLWPQRQELRIGLVWGAGCEWLVHWEEDYYRGGNVLTNPQAEPLAVHEKFAAEFGLQGPATLVATACASGNTALGVARTWLRMGWADVCVVGACDRAASSLAMAAFDNLRALSANNAEPQAASRPFDRDRDGFVIGEGGAMFVLESESSAAKRGARVYGELAGCGFTSDAHHIIIPCKDPAQSQRAMESALQDARLNPDEIDYVNAHATSTPVGDVAEALALTRVLGSATQQTSVSSTKSMTGHMLTATSAVEALVCLAALERQCVPPTINLDNPDPECPPLRHVPHTARQQRVRAVMSNAFGFGGSNSSVIFRAA